MSDRLRSFRQIVDSTTNGSQWLGDRDYNCLLVAFVERMPCAELRLADALGLVARNFAPPQTWFAALKVAIEVRSGHEKEGGWEP